MSVELTNSNFKVYLDGKEYLGIAQVTLPTLSWVTQSVSGSGIAGTVGAPVAGHVEEMSATLNFRLNCGPTIKLSAPKRHTIELRVDQTKEDQRTGKIQHVLEKHTMVVIPKSRNFGTIQPASPADGSGEYSVRYWKVSVDGKVLQEIDPLNCICKIGNVDYCAAAKKNLG